MAYFEKEAEQVFSEIENSPSIVIFGHKNPDGDCIGSVLGLREALRSYFPEKKIYGVGSHPDFLKPLLEDSDEVPLKTIQDSLAVMVDLSDLERVEDQRILQAKKIVIIDHHVAQKELPYPIVRDDKAPSCTYILTKLLLNRYHRLTEKSAYYLFLGLITDSGRFQYDSAPDTFLVASELTQYGFNTRKLYNTLYQQNGKDLRYRSYIYSHFQEEGKVAYCCVDKKTWKSYGLEENEASGKVNLLSLLDHHPMWALFTEQEDGTIRVELRSDSTYNVQKAAVAFGGGGHIPASGCKLDKMEDYRKVIDYLNQMEPIA